MSDEKILADTLDALATLSEDTTGREFRTFRDAAKALRDAAAELDRLRAANARQRAWIDGVMGQEPHSLAAVPYVFAACFVPPEHALTTKTVELITRPAPFEDK